MATADSTVLGSCFCGAVRFEITLPTIFCLHCHCTMCQRIHSAGFVTWCAVPPDKLHMRAGSDRLVRHESSEHGRRSFCGTCGTPLFCENVEHPGQVDIPLTALHAPIDRAPQMHVHFGSRAPWVTVDDELPRLGGPSGFEPIED